MKFNLNDVVDAKLSIVGGYSTFTGKIIGFHSITDTYLITFPSTSKSQFSLLLTMDAIQHYFSPIISASYTFVGDIYSYVGQTAIWINDYLISPSQPIQPPRPKRTAATTTCRACGSVDFYAEPDFVELDDKFTCFGCASHYFRRRRGLTGNSVADIDSKVNEIIKVRKVKIVPSY